MILTAEQRQAEQRRLFAEALAAAIVRSAEREPKSKQRWSNVDKRQRQEATND